MAKTENMKVALKTEADKPEITVYPHNNTKAITNAFLRVRTFENRSNRKRIICKMIPMCNPETANTCMAPEFPNALVVSTSNKLLSPKIKA